MTQDQSRDKNTDKNEDATPEDTGGWIPGLPDFASARLTEAEIAAINAEGGLAPDDVAEFERILEWMATRRMEQFATTGDRLPISVTVWTTDEADRATAEMLGLPPPELRELIYQATMEQLAEALHYQPGVLVVWESPSIAIDLPPDRPAALEVMRQVAAYIGEHGSPHGFPGMREQHVVMGWLSGDPLVRSVLHWVNPKDRTSERIPGVQHQRANLEGNLACRLASMYTVAVMRHQQEEAAQGVKMATTIKHWEGLDATTLN